MKKPIKKNDISIKQGNAPRAILRPYVSEKSQRLLSNNQYTFLIKSESNKAMVKQEIERSYGVHVEFVTMTKIRVKPGSFRGKKTYFRDIKKATVKLSPGEKLNIT